MSNKNKHLKLSYHEPAQEWTNALPLGNGRLGAMVFGHCQSERIQLNEDTLWAGIPRDKNNYEAIHHLSDVRQLLFDGHYAEGQKLMTETILGPWNESYAPMGNLYLYFPAHQPVENYRRELSLEEAVVRVSYESEGVHYQRELFVSAPDQALILNLSASQEKKISFQACLDSLLLHEVHEAANDTIVLRGKAPIRALPVYVDAPEPILYDEEGKRGMDFHIQLEAITEDGTIAVQDGKLVVEHASHVQLILVAHTSYNGFDKEPGTEGVDPRNNVKRR